MATFRFYQEKEVKTWVRDYYNVEAETLEEAIKIIQDADTSLDRLEYEDPDRVAFVERDMDTAMEWFCNDSNEFPTKYSIHSCDLYNADEPDEIIEHY